MPTFLTFMEGHLSLESSKYVIFKPRLCSSAMPPRNSLGCLIATASAPIVGVVLAVGSGSAHDKASALQFNHSPFWYESF